MAATRSAKEAAAFKADLALHWLNAKLQRAKTIPKLDRLIRDRGAPSFRQVVTHIRSKSSEGT